MTGLWLRIPGEQGYLFLTKPLEEGSLCLIVLIKSTVLIFLRKKHEVLFQKRLTFGFNNILFR